MTNLEVVKYIEEKLQDGGGALTFDDIEFLIELAKEAAEQEDKKAREKGKER